MNNKIDPMARCIERHISPEELEEIRTAYEDGEILSIIGARHYLARYTVTCVARRLGWDASRRPNRSERAKASRRKARA